MINVERRPDASISLKSDDGKYEFIRQRDGSLVCLRYGQPWREFVGDHAVMMLFYAAIDGR